MRKVVQDDGVTWATTAQLTVAETLAGWSERYPDVKVTRLVTGRSATDALVEASPHAGLIVVGAHAGGLPHDPVTRRVLASASCPVARGEARTDLRRAAPGTQRGHRRRRPDVLTAPMATVGPAWLREYRLGWLRVDILAGVTVAAYLVPQVMAYAQVAACRRWPGCGPRPDRCWCAWLRVVAVAVGRSGVQYRADDRDHHRFARGR